MMGRLSENGEVEESAAMPLPSDGRAKSMSKKLYVYSLGFRKWTHYNIQKQPGLLQLVKLLLEHFNNL